MTTCALFHVDFGAVQPSKGDRLHKVAAYNAATMLTDPTTGELYDFRRKAKEHVGGCIMLPLDSPTWAEDRVTLWSAALGAETRHDGQPARLVEILIPREVPADRRLDFARAVVAPWVAEGMAAQIDLHNPVAADGDEQPHAHVILSRRALGPDGYDKRKLSNEPWTRDRGRYMRGVVAERMNAWMAAEGLASRVDHRRAAERYDPVPAEKNVSRKSVESWKRHPDTAASDAFEKVLSERAARHRRRREIAAARDEAAQADAEIVDLRAIHARMHEAKQDRRRPSVGPAAQAPREERRARLLAALLREHYSTAWLPTSVVERIQRIDLDRANGRAVIHLTDGSRIIDTGDRIAIDGRTTQTAVGELLALADRHGWTSPDGGGVVLSGDADFRRAVAIEMLDRRPPVRVIGLDDDDHQAIEAELAQRAKRRHQEALAALQATERRAMAEWERRPGDMRASNALAAVRDAQAAVIAGDDATIRSAAAGNTQDGLTAAQAWHRRITSASQNEAEAGTVRPGPMPPGTAPRYVPPWARGQRARARRGSHDDP